MDVMDLVQAATVFGVGVVLPLALAQPFGRWMFVALAAAVAAVMSPGMLAAAWVLPWLGLAGAEALRRSRAVLAADGRTLDGIAHATVPVFALVGAGAFAQARSGLVLVGPGDPIATLTAVHFTYAGSAALALATAARNQAVAAWRSVGTVAVVLTMAAPVVVAVGFLTHGALPQVGGAVLMTAGVWCTGATQLAEAWRRRHHTIAAALLALSGASVVAPMVLAVAWALAQHADVPALSVPDMVRTHGSANAVGFVLLGLVARRIAQRPVVGSSASTAPPSTTRSGAGGLISAG